MVESIKKFLFDCEVEDDLYLNNCDEDSIVEMNKIIVGRGRRINSYDSAKLNLFAGDYFLHGKEKYCLAKKYYQFAIEQNHAGGYMGLGYVHLRKKEYELAEKNYLIAIEKNYGDSAYTLAEMYASYGNCTERARKETSFALAERYYLEAIEKDNKCGEAMNNLAVLYADAVKKTYPVVKYYLMATENNCFDALANLGCYYLKNNKYELAEEYLLMAIEKEQYQATSYLAKLYSNQYKYDLAQKYLSMGVEFKAPNASRNFGEFYVKRGYSSLAEKYFLLGVDEGDSTAMSELANLYSWQRKDTLAVKYYKLAIKNNNIEACGILAGFYNNTGNKELAEKYYLKGVKNSDGIIDLANFYRKEGKYELAEKYYLKATEITFPVKNYLRALTVTAEFYVRRKKVELAEEYYLAAKKAGDTLELENLKNFYIDHQKFDSLEKLYVGEIEMGNVGQLIFFAKFCVKYGKQDLVEKYVIPGKDNIDVLEYLGGAYYDRDNTDLSKKYLILAILNGSMTAMKTLEWVFHDKKLVLYLELMNMKSKNKVLEDKLVELSKEYVVRCLKNKRKQLAKVGECPVCYETCELIPKECVHYYCPDCYSKLLKCALCEN
ncbi:MAG: hypothetical protein Harvfovirus2_9 [Harvfovirus sp.]|uniref:RING-type domain-containing protein n=1 Tax=Harvfovirus sp. TaxID=2487768 RepID=A0A3G5A4T3_9VIRU|nr:MAG: hypothetical protein Harvfovirus2_9 [Harvfovirus sp.]